MHCFIGIEIAPPLSSEIIGLQKRWRSLDLPPADFHKHTDPHITLVPPFECAKPDGLIKDLEAIGSNFPQFNILFLHVAAFNRRIMHLAAESNAVVELRSHLMAACAGFARIHDSNPFFHPHTTLGYAQRPLTVRELSNASATLEQALSLPRRQEIASFVLFGRDKPGTRYQALADVKLNPQIDLER